jgi:phage-related protein
MIFEQFKLFRLRALFIIGIQMNRTRPRIIYPWHPEHLSRKNPLIIKDLLEMQLSKQICAQKCKQMIGDLFQNGLQSRYHKHLGGVLWELKDRTSEGGARIYFLHGTENRFFVYHAECKNTDQATQTLLGDGLEIMEAIEANQAIQPAWYNKKTRSV